MKSEKYWILAALAFIVWMLTSTYNTTQNTKRIAALEQKCK